MIYADVDSPDLGFPYFLSLRLRGDLWRKNTLYIKTYKKDTFETISKKMYWFAGEKKYIVLGNKGIIKASNIFKDSDLYYKFSTTKN